MTSLKSRLSWGLMLSLIILLALQWAVVTYAISQLTENQLSDRLQREGESLLASTKFDADGQIQVDSKRLSTMYQRPFSGHYYVIFSGTQRLISRSLWDADLNINSLQPGKQQQQYMTGPEQQPLLTVVHGYQKQQRSITIAVAEDLTPLQSGMTRFQVLYAIASITGLILLLFVQRWIILSALKPLRGVQENMARLARGETDQVEIKGPAEITPLINELNRLLIGMERKSRRSRESLGNLAHALKTRLTLLNQIAERKEIDTHHEVRTSIYAATETIGHIVERELKRARLIGDTHPGRRVNLEAEIAQLVHTLRLLYSNKSVNINWEIASGTEFFGDQEDLLEMLGNLLDNACKWCRGNVSLTVTGNGSVTFVVEDDGAGCPVDELDRLTRRGFRADESKPGSGLGLAIVHDIVESYAGDLMFGRSAALGGLRVEARFVQKTG